MIFSGAFEGQPDRRQLPANPCRHLGELCTGESLLGEICKKKDHLQSWCLCRPWRRQSTCASRTRSLRPTSKPSWKPSKSSATSSMGTSHQGMKLLPGKQIISGSFYARIDSDALIDSDTFYWFCCSFRMRQLLQLYASDSADLISRYYWERIKEQRNLQVCRI